MKVRRESKTARLGATLRLRLTRLLVSAGFKEEHFLVVLSVAIGAAAGAASCGFYWLIEWTRHLAYGEGQAGGLFAGHLWLLPVIPAAGGLAVGIIVHYFAREAKGHGVPEVMDAIVRKGGTIRPRVAIAKSLASALTIGSGGSAGTEGPIVQIGAALGSTFGQAVKIHPKHMAVLVGCGAAAGISSIFNAPIAGVLFALEIFLRDFSLQTFAPVVFASVLSSSVTHWIRGQDNEIFSVGPRGDYFFNGQELPFYLVLGLLCAVGAVAFIKLLYLVEDVFDRLKVHGAFKPCIGAVALGLCGAAYCAIVADARMPQFFGNGYPVIRQTLAYHGLLQFTVPALLGLWVMKWLATSVTLGSGGSGGVFAPSLFLGAAIGGALGLVLFKLGWIDERSMTAYALVGMAASVAGSTHAPLTAIVILIEMTRDYKVILPVMFAAIVATTVAQLLTRDSIYTLKLRRRGVHLGTVADLTILKRMTVAQIPREKATIVRPDEPLQGLLDLAGEAQAADFVVVDEDGRYRGMVTGDDVTTALLQPEAVPLLLVGELVQTGVPTVKPGETLDVVLDKFAGINATCLPVVADGDEIEGLITRRAVMSHYQAELQRIHREG